MSEAAEMGLAALEDSAFQTILTTDPNFIELALGELRTADPAATWRALAPGVLLVNGGISFGALAAIWQAAPPIFVRHICPVNTTVGVASVEQGLVDLEIAVATAILPELAADRPFSIQTRVLGALELKPYDSNQRLATWISETGGLTLDVRAPAQVVSVVAVGDLPQQGTIFVGASHTAHNLSDWAGGMRRFAREEGQISRAEFKLLEAIEVFGLELPPRGTALDLGAAPGGWTRVLRLYEQYVTAVDPADLDARLATDRGIRYKRMTAEAYLQDEPDPFDIIVNDMRLDARDSARIMANYARLLYPHGWALMTLKLAEFKRQPVLEQVFKLLRERYVIAGARHLFHNRSEITIWLRPKPRQYH